MPSEDIEKFRILKTEDAYVPAIRDWLVGDFDSATIDQCRRFLFSFCAAGPMAEAILKRLRRAECEKTRPRDIVDVPSGSLQDELILAAMYLRDSERMDNLSWVGSLVSPTDETKAITWKWISPDYFLAPFDKDGVTGGFLTIHGKPRSGKTGMGCSVMEHWLGKYPETEVLTNIPLEHPVEKVRPVTDPFLLAHGVANALIARRRWLWAWDEPTLSGYGRSDAATNVSKHISRFARIIPKLGGSLIYIEHLETGVPTVLSDFAEAHISCINPGFIIANTTEKMTIRNVPKPKRIPYRSGEAGYFELSDGFDWQGFFRALRFNPELMLIEDADQSTQGERIQAFLDKAEEPAAGRPQLHCRFCGYDWIPRKKSPKQCPSCQKHDPIAPPAPPMEK